MIDDLKRAIAQLRRTKPLVLCLTNAVTMDFMANCLLSLGAAPIMSKDIRELDELIKVCHVVNLNIGTLDVNFIDRAEQALQLAETHHKPVILDPVGAGTTSIRTTSSQILMASADIIRGNASEIMAITGNIHASKGVESSHAVSDATDLATTFAEAYQCTVVVSGAEDFITNGQQQERLAFGSPLMALVTGMGCSLTAVIGAFKSIIPDSFHAARLGTAYFGLCGALAAQKTDKPGSFRTLFIDELYTADFAAMKDLIHAI